MEQGLILTLLGMTWVCIFLIFMIIFTILSSTLIRKFFPEKDEGDIEKNEKIKKMEEHAAALAIVHHLKRRRGSK